MTRMILTLPVFLAACLHPQTDPSPSAISGEISINSGNPDYGVVRTPSFDHDLTAAQAHEEYAKRYYDQAFGGYLAACDRDHPDNCIRAADILDRKLMQHGSLSVYEPKLAKHLFEVACDGGIAPACTRAAVIQLPD